MKGEVHKGAFTLHDENYLIHKCIQVRLKNKCLNHGRLFHCGKSL